ncbi:GNAT family N-acetyltransferase [Neobacillus mesonae]|nr:GNAT family N-acetyltransferase [Neobacillus mesonae]
MNIRKAVVEEQGILKNLLQLYMYDFTEYTGVDLKSAGLYPEMPDFNLYWTEPQTRDPFVITMNDQIAGFAFVKKKGPDRDIHVLFHFFILKKYRMKGLGTAAAKQIFSLYEGKWELCQLENNVPAQKFWLKVILEITGGNFEDKFENGRRYQFFTFQ